LVGNYLTNDITPGKLVGALFRTPFSHFRENSRWLYREAVNPLLIYFVSRSDPNFRTPQAGYLDFLIFPSAFNAAMVMQDLPSMPDAGGSFVIPETLQSALTFSAAATLSGVNTLESVRTLDGVATLDAETTTSGAETLENIDSAGVTESLLDTNCSF
jgi:hypothetical protein